MSTPLNKLPENVLALLAQGNIIEAINLLRVTAGLDLKDAKEAVERHWNDDPDFSPSAELDDPPSRTVATAAPVRQQTGFDEATRSYLTPANGLAPGEVPRGEGNKWVWVAVAIVVGCWFLFND